MATSGIDKALYGAPLGLDAMAAEMEPIEIEIEDPESVSIGMGDVEIELRPEPKTSEDFDANLAEIS